MALQVHAPAAATAAVVTIVGKPDRRIVVEDVHWSFSADPAAAVALTITSTGQPTYTEYVNKGGPGTLAMGGDGYEGAINTNVVVTLPSGAGAVQGSLNVFYTEEA